MRSRQTRRIAFRLSVTLIAGCLAGSPVVAQTTPADPAAAEPTLPSSIFPAKPGSPVVESIADRPRPPLEVRKPAQGVRAERMRIRHRHFARRGPGPFDLERPALAGVVLVTPLPRPGEPPHIVVPLPEYPLDSIASAFTTPAPPIVCHRARRDPDAPDPHLYRETAVVCVPDNP